MDWLLNPKFLPPFRRNRRRRDDSESDSDEDDNAPEDQPEQSNSEVQPHASEVDYGDDDNMMYAPVRRTLPLPLHNVPASKSNSRARRRSSNKESQTGAAFLAALRSFAHKEANEPGAGCRLFIQACIFSGCDYVPNRLSKVGPITAFKMIKDASHRKHSERFDRVMKTLPRGSILQNDSNKETNNVDEDDDDGDFLSSCGSYSDMKEKYLELLTKSEAIFYYHLVEEHGSGSILPLVPHKQPDSADSAANLSPSIVFFDSDLSFIGSVEEAMKNRPTAAPPCPTNESAINNQQNSNGWINAKRPAGIVKNTLQKQYASQQPKNNHENQGPQKGTLQYAFSRTNSRSKIKPSPPHQSTIQLWGRHHNRTVDSAGHKIKASSLGHNSTASNLMSNPSSTTPKVSGKTTLTLNKPSDRSPSFSPMGRMSNFDYAEEPSARKDVESKQHPSNIEAPPDQDGPESQTVEHTGFRLETLSNEKTTRHSEVPSSPPTNSADENAFEYEIIVESPPIKSAGETRYSKYFDQLSSWRASPRRVSTSPSYKPNLSDEGCSIDHAIDLSDEPESPQKIHTDTWHTDTRSSSQTSNFSKSSVNKRPFKSSYPLNQNSQTNTRKRPRQISSGALLAGFGIPRDPTTGAPLSARQRLAARTANSKKSKAKANYSIQNFLKRT